ncbi:GyrI-like domain-containing protein [Isoptericola dokdonensis]|uniref:Bacterial transcription activator, effector binding domain n=1 Tax=Isoptericola dokdonensis DS-3 TaxID=1300344 RepID=A0A168ECW0_9MICO|nr:GyrI-like domain-containing protein [Isoptericola dokdonensis]ANC29893.1 Bacterial transcription activator, effector binding domain [Isoptericola dokdonensis DS-3]
MDEHEIRLIDHPAQATVGVRRVARTDELGDVFATLLPRVTELLDQLGVRPAGPPFGRYRDRTGDELDVEVGFPVDDDVTLPPVPHGAGSEPRAGVVVAARLPAVRVAEVIHTGPYDGLGATRARVDSWIAEHHLRPLGESWELYEAGPESDPDPATWRTRVVVAITGPAVEAPSPPPHAGAGS